MKRAIKARVIGKVQGVFFRSSAQTEAIKLGIKGWVKNTADGDVFLQAQGSEENLEQFVSWLHTGSEFAKVEQVIVESSEAFDLFHGFEVRN
jgi:acylphosphatase